ncbi:ABC transporter, partial [Mycobacterium sp. ITM-2017-0098]
PLGAFVAVTGVSGSGKSTLVCKVLGDVMARQLGRSVEPVDAAVDGHPHAGIDVDVEEFGITVGGADVIDRLVTVDQRPIGRTPRSNLATYTGLFDAVRKAFAGTA